MAERSPRAARWRAALFALHALLGAWAVSAWSWGPFHGAAVADGAEVLRLATAGSGGVVGWHGALYPALLRLALRTEVTTAWTVGLLGIAASLSVLAGISVLARRLGATRAELPAMALWIVSGSVLAFVPQPEPVLVATALLLWGATALLAPAPARAGGRAALRAACGGACLVSCVLAVPGLAPAALLVLAVAARRHAGLAAAALAGGGAALVLALAVLPFPAWPAGAGLELRLGNGGARSGTTDLRPGPALERLRLEPVVEAWSAGAPRLSADRHHLRRAADEIAADPAGAAVTLARKLLLSWQRTEIVAGADFRHALPGLLPLPLLLLSFGLVAPLALAWCFAPRGPRHAALCWPALGVLAVNVAALTSARDRLPALPFLCLAAGSWLASAPPLRAWWLPVALAVLLNLLTPALCGRPLLWPGDGELQEGELLLSEETTDPAAALLARATELGRDPRAAFLLGVATDRNVVDRGDISLRELAERWYREALAREPLYPQAADALMHSLIAQQKGAEALAFGQTYAARDPWAGDARHTLAAMLARLRDRPATRALLVESTRLGALEALARNDGVGARRGATELLRLDERDPVLDALAAASPP